MGRKALQGRAIWQDKSGAKATVAEKEFLKVFKRAFHGTAFEIRPKPEEFKNIYTEVELASSVRAEIYNPPEGIKQHGIRPDYAIDNVETKKTLYVEVKRQDGWIEGGRRSDGRGNAHERACKFFTPGLLEILRKQGRLKGAALPFWTVFEGNITRDPCRVREITLWYKGCEDHLFFWRDLKDKRTLLGHFEEKLRRLLM